MQHLMHSDFQICMEVCRIHAAEIDLPVQRTLGFSMHKERNCTRKHVGAVTGCFQKYVHLQDEVRIYSCTQKCAIS